MRAFLRRSLREQTVRWTPLVIDALAFVAGILSQAYLGRLVDAAPNSALGDYAGRFAAFLLLGIALLDLQNAVVMGLSHRIREAQHSGSLETLLATPTPPWLLLVGLSLPDVMWALVRLVGYGALGAIFFGLDVRAIDFGGVFVVVLLALVAFAALALLGAALTMWLRRGNPLSFLVAAASMIAGGVLYPRQILPRSIEWLGALLPISPALDALRAAVVHGRGPFALGAPLVALSGFALIGLPLGAFLFARALARARADGSLTAY